MLTYCVKQKKYTETIDPKEVTLKNGRMALQGICAECGIKKSRMIKKKLTAGKGVANWVLNNVAAPEMHLIGIPEGKYSFCGPFTKLKKRIGADGSVITPPVNKLDEACMYHDLAYRDHNDVESRNIADKKLAEAAANIADNSNNSWNQRGHAKFVNNLMTGKWKLKL